MGREKRFAAIDIGSNAVRLLLSGVMEEKGEIFFKKAAFIRMPVRLGEDAFLRGEIRDKRIKQLEHTMIGFKNLIEAYNPEDYRACATSAMREASNSGEICSRIKKNADIDIHIIDGKEEAEIIFSNSQWADTSVNATDVFVDVGGGSTEISILKNNEGVSNSFNIGTIRLMRDMVSSNDWHEMELWVKKEISPLKILSARASGGNIHKILSLSGNKKAEQVSINQMRRVRKLLKSYTVTERIIKLGLKPDRADVILPAFKIYFSIMKWANLHTYKVPQMGLADGIIRQLHKKNPV